MDPTKKNNIVIGLLVDIVQNKHKETQELTRGYVKRIVSNKDSKKGIKVELTNGTIGNVKEVPKLNDIKKETFKFYNEFFYLDYLYVIWDKKLKTYYIMNRMNKLTYEYEKTLLIFSSKEEAENVIKGTSLDSKDYMIRSIKRNKPLAVFFKDLNIDVFSINTKRKLTFKKLKELEEYFKSF